MADGPATAHVGTCFGYSLRSNEPLAYARAGAGPPLELPVTDVAPAPDGSEPVMTFRAPTGERVVTGHVHDEGDGRWRTWVDGGGWYVVDVPAQRIELPSGTEPIAREEALWSVPGRILLVARGDLPLHAAAIEVDGRALVLTGPTRHGKTTLAATLAAAGHRLLGEDLVDVRFAADGTPTAVPGPAYLRLRRDVADLVAVPGTTVVAESAERLHLAVDQPLRGGCAPVPVAAIVLLRLSDDEVTLGAVDPVRAVRDVWSQGFALPTAQSRAQSFHNIGRLVDAVPVLDLARPLRMAAVPRVLDVLLGEVMARA
ncbi:MAG: hypothetical protein ACJ74O_08890 [Frankiaceae bacterium]